MQSSKLSEGEGVWDWATFLYAVQNILRQNEAYFWIITPRKLTSLLNVHIKIHGNKDRGD